ncbi:MAG: PorT family protein [Sphingobacteriales bacterium]|nr:MAG: PorT family protein [Sphingobacteriales bacterium]
MSYRKQQEWYLICMFLMINHIKIFQKPQIANHYQLNDKDFIKIDDLFKGRPEREERIPPGAWRNMQDLLEKSATTGGAAGSRRYGLYAVFALLTVGMGVSALSLQHRQLLQKNNSNIAANEAKSQLSTPGIKDNITGTELSPSASGTNTAGNHSAADSATAATVKEANESHNMAAQQSAGPATIATDSRQHKATAAVTDQENNKTNTSTRSNTVKLNKTKNKITAQDASIAADIQKKSFTNPITSSSPANVSTTADIALANIDKQQFAPLIAKDSVYEAVVNDNSNNRKFVLEKRKGEWKKEVSTPVTEFTRSVQKTTPDNRSLQRIDTIRQRNYVRTQLLALSDQEKLALIAVASNAPKADLNMAAAHTTSLGNIASNVTNAAGFANLVPLENYKVKTVNTVDRRSFVIRFYDMMSTYLNKDKPFYFGASLGGQLMFSQPLQSGFHLGLGGYYEFKERYTLGVELKYLRNSYNNGSLTEHYQTYSQQTIDRSGPAPVYNALEQKFTNTYYLQNSSYLELPVTMRYQLSKLSIMGGIYGSYMMGTRYTNKMAELSGEASRVSSLKPFAATNGAIVANDFKARYGMGFTIGAAYDFSRHLSLDVRINQNLWNNLKSTSELSTNLYRATGVQLSLMYFIGKKDKVIYMMAQ